MEKIFDKLSRKIKERAKLLLKRLRAYFKRLIFPLYFFPLKLITYTTYYFIKFIFKLILAFCSIIIDTIIFPFKSLKNLLKSIFSLAIILYFLASLLVIGDYLINQYGKYNKIFCSASTRNLLQKSVVRIVGGYSEGSGFFIAPDQVLTNFHVIADEPSPKIIFPDGSFVTPIKILGNKEADLTALYTKDQYPDMVLPFPKDDELRTDEPIIAAGYPLGTSLTGKATLLKGRFIEFRKSKQMPVAYIQSDINLIPGMSGGPLTDICGNVIGVNTMGVSGFSLFIWGNWVKFLVPGFTDQNITKINVDASISPEEAVKAFYTYLKARRMDEGFKLLSQEYLLKTNFEEWTNRFTNVLDVNVIKTERFENSKDTAFVKFSTKNWVDGETEEHFYEGTWQTIKEDGVYKMLKSKIIEVNDPNWEWFY